jgi:hypothetical protein
MTAPFCARPQWLPHRPHRGRAAADLEIKQRIRIETVVGRGRFESDLSEVYLEFLAISIDIEV